MNARNAILSRIRNALADGEPTEQPPIPQVWPKKKFNLETKAKQFAESLEAVQGEIIRCSSAEETKEKLAELLDRENWDTIAAIENPNTKQAVEKLSAKRVSWIEPDTDHRQLAKLPAGLIVARHLLADTGSCIIDCNTREERLMCYMPPACVVIAKTSTLAAHMQDIWADIGEGMADLERRGEYVIVTGPSRTADIEKILILGVHGPKRLIVLLVD